jgi:hypothetical protein
MKRQTHVLAALVLGLGLLLPGATSALTFSPPTFDLSAKPGIALSQVLKLRNESSSPVTLVASTANFSGKVGDESSGIPDFYPSNEVRDGHGLGSWITFAKPEVTLLAGERADLIFNVNVPQDAGPGSYFGAVILATKSGETAENVGVTGTAAALVLLRVEGDVVEDLRLTGFTAPKFSDSLPVRFEALLSNQGTVHERPYGEVTIKNAFGREVAVLALNRAEYKSVLPGMSRRYTTSWQHRTLKEDTSIFTRQWQNFAFGPYSAEMKLRYGSQERLLTATTRFWVVPWLTLMLVVGGTLVLLWSLRRLLAWYQDRIIRRHEKGI